MHTWLPDAHSEGPAPVSVMLSGALLNTAMIGIVRFLAIADAAGIGQLCHVALVVLGALSLLVAALFIVRQSGVKRLMAYSSIEHMGVIALGFGFGGAARRRRQPLSHGQSLAEQVADVLRRGQRHARLRHQGYRQNKAVATRFPVQALFWLAGAIAITGAPPFGLFLSEFTILRAGFRTPSAWAAYLMAALLIVIFIGFINQFRRMYDEPVTEERRRPMLCRSGVRLPMALALAPLLVFGLWWPAAFWSYFRLIATQLGVGGS